LQPVQRHRRRTTLEEHYVVEYDPGRNGQDMYGRPMTCHLVATPDITKAQHFTTKIEALELWRSVDPRNPKREDGRPNRPLTAFTVEVLPDA
jgi:hypothetical protein